MSSALATLSSGSDSLDIVRASIATHSKSFSLASLALPRGVRDDTAALYAYCRRADDAVDTVTGEDAACAIGRLERELDAIYAGALQVDPVLAAFQAVVQKYQIPRHYPAELLAGMRMDVEDARYETLPQLLGYCYRVAGTVGLMMCHVLGVSNADALRNAAHLGMAMQLTNICRDVREDWERGRLYLTAELLRGFGRCELVPSGQPLPTAAAPAVATTTRFLLAWADALYESGERGIRYLPRRSAIAVRTARLVYADIGRVLTARAADPFAPRAVVSTPRKLALAARAVLATLAEPAPEFRRVHLSNQVGVEDVLCL